MAFLSIIKGLPDIPQEESSLPRQFHSTLSLKSSKKNPLFPPVSLYLL